MSIEFPEQEFVSTFSATIPVAPDLKVVEDVKKDLAKARVDETVFGDWQPPKWCKGTYWAKGVLTNNDNELE
jgi:hypothetical protein